MCRFSSGDNINIHGCHPKAIMPEELSQIPFNPVTNNCAANFLACRDAKTSDLMLVFTPHHKKSAHDRFMLCGSELKKFSPLPQSSIFWKCGRCVSNHASTVSYFVAIFTDRLLRPFALLRLITSLPFFVDILTRKPWVRLREVLLG